MLGTAVDFGVGNAHGRHLGLQPGDGVGDELFAFGTLLVDLLGNLLVQIGLQEAERQVFQFPLQFPDAKAIGQRRVQVERFAGDGHPQLVRHLGVIAQRLSTRCETQQNDADIFDCSQQHLAQNLDLRLHFGRILLTAVGGVRHETVGDRPQTIEAENTADEFGRRRAKARGQLRLPLIVVLGQREQQCRHAAIDVQLQSDKDQRHAEGVMPHPFAAA